MRTPRILIVEDEKNVADSLQRGLIEKGFETSVAYTGEKGFELAQQEAFDLVLLDLQLDKMSGFDVCRNIRLRNTTLGIIILTSLTDLTDKTNGYHAGADDYLIKPVEFDELLLKINALLKRVMNDQAPPRILVSSNLEMNLDSKEVRRDGRLINLTAREFRLLEFLLRNKNKVLTRAEIALHVWDIDFDTSTNVIDVYINYLRNKVDKHFSPKLIHTQTGIGFILKENSN